MNLKLILKLDASKFTDEQLNQLTTAITEFQQEHTVAEPNRRGRGRGKPAVDKNAELAKKILLKFKDKVVARQEQEQEPEE